MASLARGAARGALDWTKEQVGAFASKLRNRDIAFVQNEQTIDQIREERRGEEYLILKEHISDPKLRLLVVMGLTLRRLEKVPADKKQLLSLRNKILRKHGASALRAAELVQRGIVGILYITIIGESRSPADISAAIVNLLQNVDQYAVFIQERDTIKATIEDLVIRIRAHQPRTFVILGCGAAKEKAKKVVDGVLERLPGTYGAERHETEKEFYAFVGSLEGDRVRVVLPG